MGLVPGRTAVTTASPATEAATEKSSEAPVLLSVNVGMPANVSWQGKTVHTGAWKRPVDGPVMVRQINIDGDGQGDLKGTAVRCGPCWSTRFSPTGTGSSTSVVTTSATVSSRRTSPSTACLTTRSASATDTASARLSSRSPSPG